MLQFSRSSLLVCYVYLWCIIDETIIRISWLCSIDCGEKFCGWDDAYFYSRFAQIIMLCGRLFTYKILLHYKDCHQNGAPFRTKASVEISTTRSSISCENWLFTKKCLKSHILKWQPIQNIVSAWVFKVFEFHQSIPTSIFQDFCDSNWINKEFPLMVAWMNAKVSLCPPLLDLEVCTTIMQIFGCLSQ